MAIAMRALVAMALCLFAQGHAFAGARQRHHSHLRRAALIQESDAISSKEPEAETTDEESGEGDDEGDDGDDDAAAPAAATTKVASTTKAVSTTLPAELAKADAALGRAEAKLEANRLAQNNTADEIGELDNEEMFHRKLDQTVAMVSNETQTVHMARFLGDMWKEMRMFATPFYKEHLEERQEKLMIRETKLEEDVEMARVERAEAEAEARANGWDAPEQEGSKKAHAEAVPATGGGYKAKFTSDTMPALSRTMWCIIQLTTLYVMIYSALALVRTANQFTAGRFAPYQTILESATETVTYAPMLCVLFLATRMRAIQLSKGHTEKYNLPQDYVKMAMTSCTIAILGQVIISIVIPVLIGDVFKAERGDSHPDISQLRGGKKMWAPAVNVVGYVLLAMLYLGFLAVVVGCFMMEAPKEEWGDETVPVSPALQCTMILCAIFCAVYLGIAVTRTMVQLRKPPSAFLTKMKGLFTVASHAVNLAPMTAVLFIAARMRALQMDPEKGNPQRWAQNAFYSCTFAILVQVLAVLIFPLVDRQCTVKEGQSEGDIVFEFGSKTLQIVGQVLRYAALLCMYGGVCTVVVSVLVIQHKEGPEQTPPISPAMQCVITLAGLYFFAFTAQVVCQTIKQFLPKKVIMDKLVAIFGAGTKTVMFAPMLSVLFIGVRVRALQLTRAEDGTVPPTAGPQAWAQEAMYIATWSVQVQYVMTCVAPLVLGTGVPAVQAGQPPQGASKKVGIVIQVVNYVCLLAMYGGAVVVVYAAFVMTPEKLPPYSGYEGLVPGVKVALVARRPAAAQ